MVWWVPVMQAAMAYMAARKASKSASKRSPAEQLMEQLLLDQSQQTGTFGRDLLARSTDTLNPVQNFWHSALTGDRQALSSLYQPELAQMQNQSREAYRTQQQLSPRTGASTEFLSSMPQQRLLNENRLFAEGRRDAADKLGQFGTNMGSLGLSALSQGRAGASNLLDYSQDRRRYANDYGSDTGGSVYDLISTILSQYGGSKSTGTAGKLRGKWWEQYPQGNDKNAPWWGM